MAFIASYISTTGASELANYFDEVLELSTAQHEHIIKESYRYVNEVLDSFIQTPLPVQPTTGVYPSVVRLAQARAAIFYAYQIIDNGTGERLAQAKSNLDATVDELLKGRANIEAQYSQDEIGINYPISGSSNTSTALMQVDRQAKYTGSTERTYTVTATSSADIGTATYSWTDGEGNSGTGTSDYDFSTISSGVRVRWYANPSGGVAIVSGDTWKIRCVPLDIKPDAPGKQIGQIPARQ